MCEILYIATQSLQYRKSSMEWIQYLVAIGLISQVVATISQPVQKLSTSLRHKRDDTNCLNSGTWDEEKNHCICKLGWVGVACAVWSYNECYFDKGFNYRGNFSYTKEGHACLPWTTEKNSKFKLGSNGVGFHSYCRNPDNDEKGPWCYVKGNKFHDYCNVTVCPDEYRALLLMNSTEQDTGSAAVQILFGPLISGICVGVVALLAFVAVFEYRRRKRNSKRKKIQEANAIKKADIEHVDHEQRKKNKVPTFGGIVTVDVDTGKQKTKTVKLKKTLKSAEALNEATSKSYQNNAFVVGEDGKIMSSLPANISQETESIQHREPPPPYSKEETTKSPSEANGPYHEPVVANNRPAVGGANKSQPNSNSSRDGKKRRKRRPVSRLADEDLPEPPPPPAPVPKPRRSLHKTQSSGNIDNIQDGVLKIDDSIETLKDNNKPSIEKDNILKEKKRRKKRSKSTINLPSNESVPDEPKGELKTDELKISKRRRRRKDKERSEISDNSPPVDKKERRHRRRKRNTEVEPGSDVKTRSTRRSRRKINTGDTPENNVVNHQNKNDINVNKSGEVNEVEEVKKMIKTRQRKNDEPSTFI